MSYYHVSVSQNYQDSLVDVLEDVVGVIEGLGDDYDFYVANAECVLRDGFIAIGGKADNIQFLSFVLGSRDWFDGCEKVQDPSLSAKYDEQKARRDAAVTRELSGVGPNGGPNFG